jgi:hypothetical protein
MAEGTASGTLHILCRSTRAVTRPGVHANMLMDENGLMI